MLNRIVGASLLVCLVALLGYGSQIEQWISSPELPTIDKESIGFFIVGAIAAACVYLGMYLIRSRMVCPRCGDKSKPQLLQKHDAYQPTDFAMDLVECWHCEHQWLRHYTQEEICPECGWTGKPVMIKEHLHNWKEIVKCKTCGFEWSRAPIDAASSS